MSLAPGTLLGPYEIMEPIGSGGMGEVYRAQDTRLQRTVAIKTLPAGVADNPTRRARFLREAQAISQLSHPNICAIYDVGEADGVAYLVMEFIDGESLDARLRLGPAPWPTALPWAMQIASALDAAHRRGIVHRDLKPANIMIAESGVKLLDFGLAKLLEDSDAAKQATASTASLTAERTVVGTLQYMAPEQLEGRPVDARTDLFAFGATLYEVLTGRKAFQGRSPASITAAILTSDPPEVSANGATDPIAPAALDHLIRRALAKDPDERWQTARDVMMELRWILDGRASRGVPAPPSRRSVMYALAALACVMAAGLAGWRMASGASDRSAPGAIEFTIDAPAGTRFNHGYGGLALSRDCRRLAFLAAPEGSPNQVWWRSLESAEPHALVGTDNAGSPFWSPDGTTIGFIDMRDNQIKMARLDGSRVTSLSQMPAQPSASASWFSDGTIVFTTPDGLMRVASTGGSPAKLGARGTMPRELPRGRFLFEQPRPGFDPNVTIDGPGLASPARLAIESNAAYASRHLIFRQGTGLVARSFDVDAARFTGAPIPLAEDVLANPGNGLTLFDACDSVLAYRTEPGFKLDWRDRAGALLGSVGEVTRDWNPALPRDGSGRVAVDRVERKSDAVHVWTIDAAGTATQVSRGPRERFPIWSPDGQWLAYVSGGPDRSDLRRAPASGRGAEELLFSGPGRAVPLDYANDALIFLDRAQQDVFALRMTSGAPALGTAPLRLTNTRSIQKATARLSPNGRWLAVAATIGTEQEVWVQDFPAGRTVRRLGNGFDPSWSADGRELFYVVKGAALMAVPVVGPGMFGAARVLFGFAAGGETIPLHLYAASSDGQRFLVREATGAPDVITVVVNWTARLR